MTLHDRDPVNWAALEAALRCRNDDAALAELDLTPMTQPVLFMRDLMADCMTAALASQWRERAQRFREARPRPGDFHGQTTVEDRRAQWRRLTALADACDYKADLMESAPASVVVPELDDFPIFREVA